MALQESPNNKFQSGGPITVPWNTIFSILSGREDAPPTMTLAERVLSQLQMIRIIAGCTPETASSSNKREDETRSKAPETSEQKRATFWPEPKARS